MAVPGEARCEYHRDLRQAQRLRGKDKKNLPKVTQKSVTPTSKVHRAVFIVTAELAEIRIRMAAEKVFKEKKTQTESKEGVVYVITNPAWPGWCSIGCACDPEDRLAQYNRCSPFRDFVCRDYATTPTKRKSESAVHKWLRTFGVQGVKVPHLGEWFQLDHEDAVLLVKKICLEQRTNGRDS